MQTPLTALERELLGYVERLAIASETSAQALRALEARSTNRIGLRMDGLADCVSLLIRSQIESMTALRGLLSEAANYRAIDKQLSESLKQAKAAEERLRRR
jgi:hypothetical protein